ARSGREGDKTMNRMTGVRHWPKAAIVRRLLSLCMLALLLVTSIFVQGASAGLATSHRPGMSSPGLAQSRLHPANGGSPKLKYRTKGSVVYSCPAVVNSVLYVGSDYWYVYALDANTNNPNGTLLWRYKTGGAVSSSPAVVNGVLYVGSMDDYIYALDANTNNP